MSDIKFLAAKELIQEHKYDEARGILKTINHPTAKKWLRRIDELDPPFPEPAPRRKSEQKFEKSVEQEKYYKRENRRARRRAKAFGADSILRGIGVLVLWAFFSGIFFGKPVSEGFSGVNIILFLLGCGILLFGVVDILRVKD